MDEAKVLEELYLLTVRPEFKTQRAMVQALKVARASEELLVDVDGKTALAVAHSMLAPAKLLVDPACLALSCETAVAGGLPVYRGLFAIDYALLCLQVVSEASGKTKLRISTALKQNAHNGKTPANGLAGFKQDLTRRLRARDLQKRKPALLQALSSAPGHFRYTPQGLQTHEPPLKPTSSTPQQTVAAPAATGQTIKKTTVPAQSQAPSPDTAFGEPSRKTKFRKTRTTPASFDHDGDLMAQLDGNPNRWNSRGIPGRKLITVELAEDYFCITDYLHESAKFAPIYAFTFRGVPNPNRFLDGALTLWTAMIQGEMNARARDSLGYTPLYEIHSGPFCDHYSRRLSIRDMEHTDCVRVECQINSTMSLDWLTDERLLRLGFRFKSIRESWYTPHMKLVVETSLYMNHPAVSGPEYIPVYICFWPEIRPKISGEAVAPADFETRIQCSIFSKYDARFFSPHFVNTESRGAFDMLIKSIGEQIEDQFSRVAWLREDNLNKSLPEGTSDGGYRIDL